MSTKKSSKYGLQVNSRSTSRNSKKSKALKTSNILNIPYTYSQSRKSIRNLRYTNNRTIIRPYVLKFEYISIILYYYLLNQEKFILDKDEEQIKYNFSLICKYLMEITNYYMKIEEGKSNNYNKIRNQYMTKKNINTKINKNKNNNSDVFRPLNMNITEIKNKLIDIINNTKIFENKENEINLLDNINKKNYIIIIQRYVAELDKLLRALPKGGYSYKLELPIIKANLGLILYALKVFEIIDCFEFIPKGKSLQNIFTDLFYGIIDIKSKFKI